jgi:hypothetical protein
VGTPVILRIEGDGRYSLTEPDAGIEIRADFIRRDNRTSEISGELSVALAEHSAITDDNVLHSAHFNFSSAAPRAQRAKIIRERGGRHLSGVNVAELLEALCQFIARHERTGDPAIVLRDAPIRRPDETHFDVLGMRFPSKHLSILFGTGGTMKSYLALLIALTLALRGLRVLFVDWELDAPDHRYRFGCLYSGPLPDSVFYCRCRKPLVQEIDRIRRIGQAERIDYFILDSVGYGTAGDPGTAEAAMEFCRAAGQLAGGVLALAHITKNGDNNDQMPYGSVFWHNSARATWNIKQASESDDGQTLMLGAFNRKSNLGRRLPPVGIEVHITDDRVTFRNTDIATVDDFAGSLPLWRRMVTLLKGGPQTLAHIASELGHPNVESIDRIVRKHKALFTKITDSKDHITRVSLVERREAA